MPTYENDTLIRTKEPDGSINIHYPVTKLENVQGGEKLTHDIAAAKTSAAAAALAASEAHSLAEGAVPKSQLGVPGGAATLGGDGKLTPAQRPVYGAEDIAVPESTRAALGLGADATVDDALGVLATPIGGVRIFGREIDNPNWLLCDGRILDPAGYSELYEAIGNMYSLNKWTLQGTLSNFSAICYSPELKKYVSIINSSLHSSDDGVSWISHSVTGTVTDVCWSPELEIFVASGYRNPSSYFASTFYTSSDGTNWTLQYTDSSTSQSYSICWSPKLGIFLATQYKLTSSSPTAISGVYTSPDGVSWTKSNYSFGDETTDASKGQVAKVRWIEELSLFVLACNPKTIASGRYSLFTSSNGTSWTGRVDSYSAAKSIRSTSYSPELNMLIAVGSGTGDYFPGVIFSSSNGTNWQREYSTTDIGYTYMVSADWDSILKRFIVLGYTEHSAPNASPYRYETFILTSSDGWNWTKQLSFSGRLFRSLVYCSPDTETSFLALYVDTASGGSTQRSGLYTGGTDFILPDYCFDKYQPYTYIKAR